MWPCLQVVFIKFWLGCVGAPFGFILYFVCCVCMTALINQFAFVVVGSRGGGLGSVYLVWCLCGCVFGVSCDFASGLRWCFGRVWLSSVC